LLQSLTRDGSAGSYNSTGLIFPVLRQNLPDSGGIGGGDRSEQGGMAGANTGLFLAAFLVLAALKPHLTPSFPFPQWCPKHEARSSFPKK
jgi:hypothetical protein